MTSTIIHSLSDKDLLDEIHNLGLSPKQISQRLRRGNQIPLISELIDRTQFLNEHFQSTVPILARIYCLNNGIFSIPRCARPNCENLAKWRNGINEFSLYCCHECAIKDESYWNRVHQTMIERHGGIGLSSSKIKQRVQETNLVRYDSISPFGNKKVQEKCKQTFKKRYNVECSLLAFEVKNKIQDTIQRRHGVRHYSMTDEFKNRIHDAWMHKSPEQKRAIVNKRLSTTNERYGVDNVFQSDEIKKKIAQTLLEQLGVENSMQCETIKQKFKTTMNERYGGIGFQSPIINEKIEATMLTTYGVAKAYMSEAICRKISNKLRTEQTQDKIRQTFLSKYGVEWYTQSAEYHKNKKHKFHSEKYPELTFDSRWEVKVYEFCKDNNIPVEYSPSISYEYDYCGKKHTYHPDFRINNKMYEVKGDQFFDVNGQMINPYDRTKDEVYESKHQCMLDNDVNILRKSDIQNIARIVL